MKNILLSSGLIGALLIGLTGCGGYSNSLKPSEVRKDINSYSEEDQIKAVKYYSSYIKDIKNPSLKVQEAALTNSSDCRTLEYIQNPHSTIVNRMLPFCFTAIKYIKNPTEEQQLTAVRAQKDNEYNTVLSLIKNPSKKVQIEAIKYNVNNLKDIGNPTENMQLSAIKQSRHAYFAIRNPSKNVRKEHIQLYPWFSAQLLKNLTKEEQLFIVNKKPTAIQFFKMPSEEVQLSSIVASKKLEDRNLDMICNNYIKNPTKTVKKECKKLMKFKNLRHNFLKDTMANQPYFEIGDNVLSARIYAVYGSGYISNHTNKFMKLKSFSIYYGDDIYTKQVDISLPPRSKSKIQAVSIQTVNKFYIPVKSYDQSLNVGIAAEYEIEGKRKTFYKSRSVKYKEEF